MNEHPLPKTCRLDENDPFRMLLEGTATATGERFFAALVENLSGALQTKHGWVTEYFTDLRRLKALAFWIEGELLPDFEIDIDGTPCESLIDKARLVFYPDNIGELFPRSGKTFCGAPPAGLRAMMEPERAGTAKALPSAKKRDVLMISRIASTADAADCRISRARTAVFTGFALAAFAANSVICRMALGAGAIDAASYASIRLIAGAITLALVVRARKSGAASAGRERGSWGSTVMLFLYAAAFSYAYFGLSTGTGALILFGSVQATMIIAGVLEGERMDGFKWLGLLAALAGLVYLVLPGLEAPPLFDAALMALAGFGWGVYSLRGRGVGDPLGVTADNFTKSVPLALLLFFAWLSYADLSLEGAMLAVFSGVVTSGLGYVAWYAALRKLSATRAASVQMLVPVIAALGGVVFLAEHISLRLLVSSLMVIGGVGSIFWRRQTTRRSIGLIFPSLEVEAQ